MLVKHAGYFEFTVSVQHKNNEVVKLLACGTSVMPDISVFPKMLDFASMLQTKYFL